MIRNLELSNDVSHHACPWTVAKGWPLADVPLVLMRLGVDRYILPTVFTPIPFESLANEKIYNENSLITETRVPRWVGVLSYDEFSETIYSKQKSILFRVDEGLIFENSRTTKFKWNNSAPARFHVPQAYLDDRTASDANSPQPGWLLSVDLSDETYLQQVQTVLSEIKKGTYYQLNLLRYFVVNTLVHWPQLCGRLAAHGGPWSTLIRMGNQIIASFSPENFLRVRTQLDGSVILTCDPIKGTAPRISNDPVADRRAAENLMKCQKNLAELHMIIDLIRNDLFKVAERGSVQVDVENGLISTGYVHHLWGRVRGMLRKETSWFEVLKAMAPGGSITGTPKIEVMKHIRRLEGRERGFFMGHALAIGPGWCDASVLIRTMLSDNGGRVYRYAAGSGLTIKSDPEEELREVAAKCRVLTDN